MAPILGYWDIRGLGESIRYLLHYKGVDFEDKRYYTYPSWMEEKFKLGFDFPNLPYLVDGDVRLTQSVTIMRYLADKYELNGSTPEVKIQIQLAEQQIVDVRTRFLFTCYSPHYESMKPNFVKNLPFQIKQLSKYLGNKKFIVADEITYVDFIAYEVFDFLELFMPGLYKDYPNIKDYITRFENLPPLQDYFNSAKYKRWPIFGPVAYFGGNGDEPKKT